MLRTGWTICSPASRMGCSLHEAAAKGLGMYGAGWVRFRTSVALLPRKSWASCMSHCGAAGAEVPNLSLVSRSLPRVGGRRQRTRILSGSYPNS